MPEQKRGTAGGGYGGKATDQREHRTDGRVPDTELEQRVERPARCAGSSRKGKADTVHSASSPCDCPSTTGQLLRFEAERCAGSRWNDMERVRDGSGSEAGRLTQPNTPGNVSSATFQESLHSQSGWTTAALGHRRPGGQSCPARGGDSPESDL